ncbi:hypothetical protein Rhe02_15230 [Rhizocola hellebori]|uniref:Carrier domain-containing protein n=1 Tax=Rhizocola hellebori TaxID=1392758 RepID=A0A8J3Q4Y5_9ACTN|nr:acyl carrier protein [Rhizocola hellebori]GIH03456.1 hypothetical protein Rhe02_15230 [Rhizocola hellebori]
MSSQDAPIADQAVYEAVVDAVDLVCGLSRSELDPNLTIDELGIDSLSAAEIVQEVEKTLEITVDMTTITSSWSSFTLAGLAKMFVDTREAGHGS